MLVHVATGKSPRGLSIDKWGLSSVCMSSNDKRCMKKTHDNMEVCVCGGGGGGRRGGG